MTARRGEIVTILALALGVILCAFWGCAERPESTEFDNPLDPLVFGGSDPFQVSVDRNGQFIDVTWRQPANPGVDHYLVLHSNDGVSFEDVSGNLAVTGDPEQTYTHEEPTPNSVNYYKVKAEDVNGRGTSVSTVVADATTATPLLRIEDDLGSTATRFVTLTLGTMSGDSVQIADNLAFTASTTLAAVTGDTTVSLDWDLGPAAAGSINKFVHMRVKTGGEYSVVASDSTLIQFLPVIRLADFPAPVADRLVDLVITTPGDSMRFAASEEALAEAAWLAPDTLLSGYELADDANPQTIYGEFLSDFGFTATAQATATPDDLIDAGFFVESLDGDADITATSTIRVVNDATATEVRFWGDLAPGEDSWRNYADTLLVELSDGEGLKLVHAQFRNYWSDSRLLTDLITYVQQPLTVAFASPVDGALLRGGSLLTVAGIAQANPELGPIELVEVDLGTGDGFVPATGTDQWVIDWDVPMFDEDTELTIRARATTDLETATAAVSVTITQLIIGIASPADGAYVIGGSTGAVTGIAAPAADGAPIDSVQVDTGDGWTTAIGTNSWSASWIVPEVTTDTEVTLHARVIAGEEIAATSITVTLTQPVISIVAPPDAAIITGGTVQTISGTAVPATMGAPLDSVKVDVGDGWIAANGLENWSYEWNVPTVTEVTPTSIKARVWAGIATAIDSISVDVSN